MAREDLLLRHERAIGARWRLINHTVHDADHRFEAVVLLHPVEDVAPAGERSSRVLLEVRLQFGSVLLKVRSVTDNPAPLLKQADGLRAIVVGLEGSVGAGPI